MQISDKQYFSSRFHHPTNRYSFETDSYVLYLGVGSPPEPKRPLYLPGKLKHTSSPIKKRVIVNAISWSFGSQKNSVKRLNMSKEYY